MFKPTTKTPTKPVSILHIWGERLNPQIVSETQRRFSKTSIKTIYTLTGISSGLTSFSLIQLIFFTLCIYEKLYIWSRMGNTGLYWMIRGRGGMFMPPIPTYAHSVCRFVWLSVSVYLDVCVSVCLCLSVYTSLFFFLSLYVCQSLSICLYVCLYLYVL